MINIIDADIDTFRNAICQKRVVLFGAGRTAQNCFEVYNIEDKIQVICDEDKAKIGKRYTYCEYSYPICSSDTLRRQIDNKDDYAFLISTTIYALEIVEILDDIPEFDGIDCYFHLLLRNHFSQKKGVTFTKGKELIPKKIHYCWFGNQYIPEKLQNYMETWKQTNPDFEIIRHDETNYDINKNQYMREAYEKKAWGFVPDYARLDIIYHEGGIYLDTDVELFRSLSPLIHDRAFFGFGDNTVINLGNGFGAVKKMNIIKRMRDYYDDLHFVNKDGSLNRTPCPLYQAPIFREYGFKPHANMYQIKDGVVVYPNTILNPIGTASINEESADYLNSFACHHDNRSWFSKEEMDSINGMKRKFLDRLRKGQK